MPLPPYGRVPGYSCSLECGGRMVPPQSSQVGGLLTQSMAAMSVLSLADQGSLPQQVPHSKGEARRAYGEGKETSLRPIRRASISAISIHVTTSRAQPTGISGQFTPGNLEVAGADLSAFRDPAQASTHNRPRSAAHEPPDGLPEPPAPRRCGAALSGESQPTRDDQPNVTTTQPTTWL